MHKVIISLFITFSFIGCDNPEKDAAILMLKSERDSLAVVSSSQSLIIDSLKSRLVEQTVLIRFTREKCRKYAAIVKKDPSQSVFIKNWIERSFQWTEEK